MWIQTFTGKRFDFQDLQESQICIEDIATALSRICRFNGHTSRFYSVAEHSVFMSYRVNRSIQREALMHDAAEAYIGDIARPIKYELACGLCEAEEDILRLIANQFDLDYHQLTVGIKHADLRMLETERQQLINNPMEWEVTRDVEPYPSMMIHRNETILTLPCWGPDMARKRFLERFDKLFNGRE
jgi:hypothetical protein